jgi:hypothetical protein
MKVNDEVKSLFRKVLTMLGAPIMEVELTEEMLCNILELSIEDYAEKVQNWTIENQWSTLYGKELSNMDLAHALSVRSLDTSRDFTYWFSKEVGLQQRGSWELKKDFVVIEAGKQDYLIPAGREINSVMFVNPPTTQAALYANYGGLDSLGFAGAGFGGSAAGGGYGPIGGFYIAQSSDIAYMATDLAYKTRLLRGDLTYKVTAGPNGTRILHLYSTPGSKFTFGGSNMNGMLSLVGCNVFYTYYDTTFENVDECRIMNPDVIITPDQIPLSKMEFSLLNEPTKVIVRKIFTAKAKQALAQVRGKFSGKLGIMEAEAMLDYQMLLTQSEKEYDAVMKELEERLVRMSPSEQLKKQAEMVDSTLKILSGKPMKMITC